MKVLIICGIILFIIVTFIFNISLCKAASFRDSFSNYYNGEKDESRK